MAKVGQGAGSQCVSECLPALKTEDQFQNLLLSGYHKTSEPDANYNCVAWAAEHDKTKWWEPAEPLEPGMHWPVAVPKGYYPENFVGLFDHLGFSICNSAELVPALIARSPAGQSCRRPSSGLSLVCLRFKL